MLIEHYGAFAPSSYPLNFSLMYADQKMSFQPGEIKSMDDREAMHLIQEYPKHFRRATDALSVTPPTSPIMSVFPSYTDMVNSAPTGDGIFAVDTGDLLPNGQPDIQFYGYDLETNTFYAIDLNESERYIKIALPITTNGQTAFTLPVAAVDVEKSEFQFNTADMHYGTDYTITGTTLTIDPISLGYGVSTTDTLLLIYFY